ncbi:8-oxo-dGTP diphosphatase [Streptococcus rupicaprae]|uniref:8-oxo-dGTP diphosphatase n=1 Tax=Streptococcus rupicaprae TaxID=759619 RepID=A0ABV2FK49_9STRE
MALDLMYQTFHFSGSKIALLCGDQVLTILRDDKPGIPYPNIWDLPGGGREGNETPFACVAREVYEELGLTITPDQIHWVKSYAGIVNPDKRSVFMVGTFSQSEFDQIRFGDEGQAYKLMAIEEFLKDESIIPQLRQRLGDYMEGSYTS